MRTPMQFLLRYRLRISALSFMVICSFLSLANYRTILKGITWSKEGLRKLSATKYHFTNPFKHAKVKTPKLLTREETIDETELARRISQSLVIHSEKQIQPVKLLCMVKTCPANIVKKAAIVKQTWGKQCDKLLFISSKENTDLPAIGILPNATDSRKLLAQKVFGGLRYVFEHFINDYDWFYVCDDDTYVIVENMRLFLSVKNKSSPEYYGHRFHKYNPQGYSSGGSGYVMSQRALELFGNHRQKHKTCNQSGAGSDYKVGQCLYDLGVVLKKSTDSKGRSRFHCFSLDGHLFGNYPMWYKNYTALADGYAYNYISEYPISFHYSAGRKMLVLHHLLYRTAVFGLKIARNSSIT